MTVTTDPYAHLRDKLFAYASPSPGTAPTRFYLRGDEVWTIRDGKRLRGVGIATVAELASMVSRGVLVVDEDEVLSTPRSLDGNSGFGGIR